LLSQRFAGSTAGWFLQKGTYTDDVTLLFRALSCKSLPKSKDVFDVLAEDEYENQSKYRIKPLFRHEH
jgi:hypothetical protein